MSDPNFERVAAVSRSLEFGLHDIANGLRELLRTEAWRSFVDPAGRRHEYVHFEAFVVTPPPKGLGTTLDALRRVVSEELDVLDLLDQATQRPRGPRPESKGKLDNIKEYPDGTSRQQALRRLRKSRPDLHARVIAGEVSPHAAMVEAGFRPKTITVPLEPAKLVEALRRRLSRKELAEVRRTL